MERRSSMSSFTSGDDVRSGRALQRHATSDLSFFTPSSESFHPRPYFPQVTHAPARTKATTTIPSTSTSLQREPSISALQQKALDVSSNDPDATFIRYPFTSFPDAHLYPEGLTYMVMAEHPNWFLDPVDFRTENDTDPNRIPYPQALEPPRGWCPVRKKDVKEKGREAFNADDAPKLRCTFCRRAYAGVNAKSMWRRHVLEKHKIPMSNRRDGPSEGSGRGRTSSNKENKRSLLAAPVKNDGFSIQNFFKPKAKETLSTPLPAAKGISENCAARNVNKKPRSPSPALLDEVFVSSKQPEEIPTVLPKPTKPSEPEFVPDDDAKSNSSHRSPQFTSSMLPPSSPLEGMSHLSWLDLSPSRASPTKTPNLHNKRSHFRMPWKFPSPSHPLYSGPDELCLAVPIGGMTGEGLRSSYVALQASPFPGATGNQSQFSSPSTASPLSRKPVTGRVLGWKHPKDRSKSKLPPLPDPSPRRPLYTGPLPVPMTDSFQLSPPTMPDLTFSTDSDPDRSFSTLGEPFSADAFSSWFEMSSPVKADEKGKKGMGSGKGKGDRKASGGGLLDTPLRRSASSASIERLQLVTPDKETEDEEKEEKEEPTSRLLPSGFGLGLNFKINLSAIGSGAKRARSEDPEDRDHVDSDEFGQLLYPSPSPEKSQSSSQPAPKGDKPSRRGHKAKSSSLSSVFGGCGETSSTEREDVPPTDVDSEDPDLDSVFGKGESLPMKKRRLFV